MGAVNVPVALADRLGEPAAAALAEMFEDERHARTELIVQRCTDRFERRLVEETSKLHIGHAQLRGEFEQLRGEFEQLRGEFGGLRGEFVGLRGEFVGLRGEFGQLRADIRNEMSGLRAEMATNRFELLKWAFLFWVGQFVSVAGFVGLMLSRR